MSLQIRMFRKDDLDCLLGFDGRPSKQRANKLRSVYYIPSFSCWLNTDDDEIVGFIIMEDRGDNSHYMPQISVTETWRRQKVGTQLVRHVFDITPGGHISLCVNTDNRPAILFYESLKFKPCGFTAGYRKGQDKFWYNIDL